MYFLVDRYGIIRGQTSDRRLVKPLKEALEFVLGKKIIVARRTKQGEYILGM